MIYIPYKPEYITDLEWVGPTRSNAGLMLGQRRRLWPSIKPASDPCVLGMRFVTIHTNIWDLCSIHGVSVRRADIAAVSILHVGTRGWGRSAVAESLYCQTKPRGSNCLLFK